MVQTLQFNHLFLIPFLIWFSCCSGNYNFTCLLPYVLCNDKWDFLWLSFNKSFLLAVFLKKYIFYGAKLSYQVSSFSFMSYGSLQLLQSYLLPLEWFSDKHFLFWDDRLSNAFGDFQNIQLYLLIFTTSTPAVRQKRSKQSCWFYCGFSFFIPSTIMEDTWHCKKPIQYTCFLFSFIIWIKSYTLISIQTHAALIISRPETDPTGTLRKT